MMRSSLWIAPAVLLFGCHASSSPDTTALPSPTAALEARPAHGATGSAVAADPGHVGRGTPLAARPGNQLAAFAAGCFWGVEDAFRKVPGVTATAVGYTGGHTKDPTYEVVCDHGSGHAEAVLIEFDPKVVTYERLLTVFFRIHDPTTPNRQGPDVGDQYRSAVFTFSPAQEATARELSARHQTKLGRPVVTQIGSAGAFYKAEDYHQQYAEKTGNHGCAVPGVAEGT